MQYQYKTLEEYRAVIPSFTIVKTTDDSFLMSGGVEYDIAKDTEILMINSDAKKYIKQSGAIRSPRQLKDCYRLYGGQNLNGKRLMIWRSGGIGDLLFIRPIMMHLKRMYPDSHISLATRQNFHELALLWSDCLNGLSGIPMNMEDVDAAHYHLSFQGLIEQCTEACDTDVHDLFAKHAGLDPEEIEWTQPITLPPLEEDDPCRFFSDKKYMVVQYRASPAIRTPLYKTVVTAIDAATSKGVHVVVSDVKERARDIDNLISCCRHPDMVCNFAYHTRGLVDALRLVTNAVMVVAPDSAQMHMAAMQGVPAVGLYGPFPGAVRCSRYPLAKWIEPNASKCCGFGGRHCFFHQYMKCPVNQSCWRNMDNARLGAMVEEMLCTNS